MASPSKRVGLAILGMWLLATIGCGSVVERDGPAPGPAPLPVAAPANAPSVHTEQPLSRYGNPAFYDVFGKRYYTLKSSAGFSERGVASWYGPDFHGRRTSSGEVYDMYRMTAAHKELPLPCYVRVINLENGRNTVLKVNDRGPFHDNRVIDLSYAAALKLGVTEKGTAFVEVVAVNGPSERATPTSPVPVAQQESAPPAAETREMFLQIGAFSERPNAERLSDRVEKLVPAPVRVFETVDGGRPIYRVQVGPIATVDSVDHLVATLFGLGIHEHHFVAN